MPQTSDSSEAAAQFFLMHLQFVRRCACYYAPFPDMIDDVVQDTYVEFIRQSHKWDLSDAKKGKSLLGRITHQVIHRVLRQKRKLWPSKLVHIIDKLRKTDDPAPIDEFEYQRELVHLRKCIDLLSARGQQLIRMYYFDNMPTRKIAEVMHLRPETVNRNLSRLRVKLKKYLKIFLGRDDKEKNFRNGDQ